MNAANSYKNNKNIVKIDVVITTQSKIFISRDFFLLIILTIKIIITIFLGGC